MPEEATLAVPPPPKPEDFGTSFTRTAASAPLPGDPVSLAPMTERAASAAITGTRSAIRVRDFAERNVVPGIPLDTDTGIDAWDRLVLSTRNAESDQLRYLANKYGPDKVRRGDTGEWIVRVDDPETGKPRDIRADPAKITLGDFAALVGDVPEIAGYVIAEKGAAAAPLLKRMGGVFSVGRDIVAGAGGAAVAGAAKDAAVRLGEAPIDPAEIARRRATQFKYDVALGGVTVPVQRFMQWSKSPFGGSRTETQINAIDAQRYLKERYGVEVPLTIGELTGNPDIIRREKFTGKIMGGSATYLQFKQEQTAAMEKLQRIMQGAEPSDDEALGQQIIAALQKKIGPEVAGVEVAGKALESAAQSRIMQLIEGRTLPAVDLTRTQVGEALRTRLTQLRDAAKAEADRLYDEFRGITGDKPNIPAADLASAAQAIKKDAASSFRPTHAYDFDTKTGTFTATKTGMKVEPSTAFVPEASVMRRIDELIANKDRSYRFSDLQKMRAEVYDDLAKSEAVPGMGAHYLSRIANALTDAMEKGVAGMADPRAKAALEAANKHYREQVVPFSKKGINEVFRNEFESGGFGPAELTTKLMEGSAGARTDRYNLFREMLGANSGEFKLLQRSIADDILINATEPGGETLNARKFLNSFSDFTRNNKEIARDVFGPAAVDLVEQAKFMIRAQEGAKFDAEAVRKLLASPSPTRGQLVSLLRAESAKDKVVSSQLLKAIADQSTAGLSITPEDVVNRFINKPERNMGEVTQLLGLLSDRPALTEDIRTKYLESLFKNASDEGRTFAQALQKAGGDKKARAVLGDKLFEDTKRFGMLKEAQEFPRTVAEQAGAMAGSTLMDKLLVHPLKTARRAVREFVTAKVLTSDQLRALVSNVNPSDPGALQLILTSTPFVESVVRNFGPGKDAENFMQSVKVATDDWMKGMGAVEAQRKRESEEFERSIPPAPSIDTFRRSTNAPPAR